MRTQTASRHAQDCIYLVSLHRPEEQTTVLPPSPPNPRRSPYTSLRIVSHVGIGEPSFAHFELRMFAARTNALRRHHTPCHGEINGPESIYFGCTTIYTRLLVCMRILRGAVLSPRDPRYLCNRSRQVDLTKWIGLSSCQCMSSM